MYGTGEGHIEQVQVVHRVLQVLVLVVVLVDGAHHLLLAVVDGRNGERVERRLVGFAPQDVGHLKAPVAEGNQHVAELQSLRLVYRQDAHAAGLVALDGLPADGRFPLADKGVDIGGIVLRKLVQLVVECAEIRTLVVQTLQIEDGVQPLGQFVERQLQELRSLSGKRGRQQVVKGLVAYQQILFGTRVAQHRTVI